jgi:hypothetical protein
MEVAYLIFALVFVSIAVAAPQALHSSAVVIWIVALSLFVFAITEALKHIRELKSKQSGEG